MIAAIYARKSTEQNGADADAKSVAGGELAPLLTALQTYDNQRQDLESRLAAIQGPRPMLNPGDGPSATPALPRGLGRDSCGRTFSRDNRSCCGGSSKGA